MSNLLKRAPGQGRTGKASKFVWGCLGWDKVVSIHVSTHWAFICLLWLSVGCCVPPEMLITVSNLHDMLTQDMQTINTWMNFGGLEISNWILEISSCSVTEIFPFLLSNLHGVAFGMYIALYMTGPQKLTVTCLMYMFWCWKSEMRFTFSRDQFLFHWK